MALTPKPFLLSPSTAPVFLCNDLGRPRDALHRKAVRHSEHRLAKRHLSGQALGQQQNRNQAGKRKSKHREHAGKLTERVARGREKAVVPLAFEPKLTVSKSALYNNPKSTETLVN